MTEAGAGQACDEKMLLKSLINGHDFFSFITVMNLLDPNRVVQSGKNLGQVNLSQALALTGKLYDPAVSPIAKQDDSLVVVCNRGPERLAVLVGCGAEFQEIIGCCQEGNPSPFWNVIAVAQENLKACALEPEEALA